MKKSEFLALLCLFLVEKVRQLLEQRAGSLKEPMWDYPKAKGKTTNITLGRKMLL